MRVLSNVMLGFMLAAPLASILPSMALAQTSAAQPSTGEADFRKWLKSLETDGTKVSSGEMQFDPASETLTVSDLVITSRPAGSAPNAPSAEITLAKLSLTKFAAANDGYQFAAAAGDGLAFGVTGAASALTLAHIEAGKSYLPSIGEFKADPERPITSQIGFLTILSRASIESMVATDIAAAAGVKAQKLSLSAIAAGRISNLSLSGFAYGAAPAASNSPPDSIGLAVTEFAVKNVDIAAYIRLFDESAYLAAGAAKPWSNFIEAVAVKGLVFKNGPVSISVDNTDLGSLKVRQFPQNITTLFDSVARDPNYLRANPADAQTISTAVRQSFVFEKASLANLAINAPNGNGNVSIVAGSIAFSNLTATHVDQLGVHAFKITDAGGTIGVRALQLGDVNLPLPAPGSAANAGPLPVAIPTVGSVKAEGLDVNAGGMTYGFDQLDVSMSYFVGTTPTNVKASVQHVRFPVAQITNVGLRQLLTDFGYADVDLSAEISGAWQDSASALAFDNIQIAGAEMGTINLSGSLTGVTRNGIEHPASALGSEIMAGGLQNFRLSFENASIFDRFLVQAAKANNKTPDELKKILSANMPAILAQIPSPAIRNKFVFAAVSFINTPKIFDLVATTSDVTPIQDVIAATREPYKLPVVLKLDASANDRK